VQLTAVWARGLLWRLHHDANQVFITSVRRLRAPQAFAKVIVGLFVVFLVLTFIF
jgi:hypothetical protein